MYIPHRKDIRLDNYDYFRNGAYGSTLEYTPTNWKAMNYSVKNKIII